MNKWTSILTVIAAILGGSVPTTAQKTFVPDLVVSRLRGSPGRSGPNANRQTVLSPPGDRWVLFRVSWRELGDQPCLLVANFWSYVDGQYTTTDELINGCKIGATGGFQGSRTLAATSQRHAMDGIRVCTNNRTGANHKMKGLRAFFSDVSEDPADRVPGGMQEAVYRNCTVWHDVKRCQEGTVATALVVNHRGRAAEPGFTPTESLRIRSLAVRCREATIRYVPG